MKLLMKVMNTTLKTTPIKQSISNNVKRYH